MGPWLEFARSLSSAALTCAETLKGHSKSVKRMGSGWRRLEWQAREHSRAPDLQWGQEGGRTIEGMNCICPPQVALGSLIHVRKR